MLKTPVFAAFGLTLSLLTMQFPASADASELRASLEQGKVQVTISGAKLDAVHFKALEESLAARALKSPFSKGGKLDLTLRGEDADAFISTLQSVPSGDDLKDEVDEQVGEFLKEHFGRNKRSRHPGKVVIGQSIEIKANDRTQDLVVIGGSAKIYGQVHGLVSIGSRIELLPGAKITGEWVRIGSEVLSDPKAIVEAEEVGISFPWSFDGKSGPRGSDFICTKGSCVLWMLGLGIGVALLFWLLGLLYFLVAPKFAEQAGQSLPKNWGASFGWGMLGILGFVPGILFLVITIVGIFLIPLYVLAFGMLFCAGYFVAALTVSRKAFARWAPKAKWPRWAMLLIGMVALGVIKAIPLLGPLAVGFIGIAGFGAVLEIFLTRSLARVGQAVKSKK